MDPVGSLFGPSAQEGKASWGPGPGLYLVVGGKARSAMRHLTKVVGPIPSRTWGTRGSWRGPGGESSGSTELLVPTPTTTTTTMTTTTFCPHHSRFSTNHASERLWNFMDLPQWGGALVSTSRCSPLIGQDPTGTAFLGGVSTMPGESRPSPPRVFEEGGRGGHKHRLDRSGDKLLSGSKYRPDMSRDKCCTDMSGDKHHLDITIVQTRIEITTVQA